MTDFSNYAENRIMNSVFNNTAGDLPITTVYAKLHLGDPGEDGTGSPAVEVTRQAVSFGAASNGVSTSDADTTWTSVSTSETYSHISLWDAATVGNCIAYGSLTASNNAKAPASPSVSTVSASDGRELWTKNTLTWKAILLCLRCLNGCTLSALVPGCKKAANNAPLNEGLSASALWCSNSCVIVNPDVAITVPKALPEASPSMLPLKLIVFKP